MSKLTVAGIGPGEADYILPAVIQKMKEAHTVIAAKRILPVLEELCLNNSRDSQRTGLLQRLETNNQLTEQSQCLESDKKSDSKELIRANVPEFFPMGKIKDTLEQIGKTLSEGTGI